jgi:transposase
MGGRGGPVVDDAARAELERLSRSAARREADRARAVLWSLDGETSAAIAARLGVRAEQVRRWRSAVRSGGVAALRARPRPGRAPRKREAALAVARDVLATPIADRPAWTLARLAAEVAARAGETISPGHLSVVLRRGATAGAGRGTASRVGKTRTPSTALDCGSGCGSSRPRPATSTSCSGTSRRP